MGKRVIFVILLVALLCRFYHITFPVAGFAGWRQADTAAIAKNFYGHGFNILMPQIDWDGNSPGHVETEFPLYPYLLSLLYAIFSPADYWGRILSVAFSVGAVWGLYLLVRKYLGVGVALWTALIYAILPLNIYYTRAVMPESMMLSCSIFGIYFFSEWIDTGRDRNLLLSGACIALAALLKIPALYLGLPILWLAWTKYGRKTFAQSRLWIYALMILLPVVLWYYHAHQIYLSTGLSFGIWDYGTGKWGNFTLLVSPKYYNDIFLKSIAERHLTYAGFILFLMGLFIRRTNLKEKLFDWWLIAVIVYFAIVAAGNQIHEYYQLPFVIPASIFMGKTCHRYLSPDSFREYWKSRRATTSLILACVAVVPVLSFLRVQNFMRGERLDGSLFKLGQAVREKTLPSDLIVAVDQGDPVVLYRCNRRGWHASPDHIEPEFLDQMQARGGKYLAGMKDYFDDPVRQQTLRELLEHHPVIVSDSEYFIVGLTQR